tara:strand:+ start:375 stop:635 length:261 start_codon:yes stop_codon:yes gene_type:complete
MIKLNKIIESINKEFGDINEGPSYEYKKYLGNIDKGYKLYAKNILDFYELLRKKGLDKEASMLLDAYKKNMVTFKKTFDKIVRKLM